MFVGIRAEFRCMHGCMHLAEQEKQRHEPSPAHLPSVTAAAMAIHPLSAVPDFVVNQFCYVIT